MAVAVTVASKFSVEFSATLGVPSRRVVLVVESVLPPSNDGSPYSNEMGEMTISSAISVPRTLLCSDVVSGVPVQFALTVPPA